MVGFLADDFIALVFQELAHQNFFVLPALSSEVREGQANFDFAGRLSCAASAASDQAGREHGEQDKGEYKTSNLRHLFLHTYEKSGEK